MAKRKEFFGVCMNEVVSLPGSVTNGESLTLAETAYRKLRQDIIEGVHKPGTKLRVEHLKDNYDVGAGTLREALQLLLNDGLVVAQGHRGFTVAPMSAQDFQDITRTRVMIETEALRQAIALGDDQWEAEVMGAFHMLSRAESRLGEETVETRTEWERKNRLFHDTLISACPSRWLKQFQHLLYMQSERYRRLILSEKPIPRDVHAEHEEILNATLNRDPELATQILAEHINRSLIAVQKLPKERFGK